MNLSPLSYSLQRITFAVSNLSKRNFKLYVDEIYNIVSVLGTEAERHFIRCLFSTVDFSADNRSSNKDTLQVQLLSQEFPSLTHKSNFISTICFAIENPLPSQKTLKTSNHQLLNQVAKVLKFSLLEETLFCLALHHSQQAPLKKLACNQLRSKLPQLISRLLESDLQTGIAVDTDLRDTSIEVLHLIISSLQDNSFRASVGIKESLKDNFIKAIEKGYPQNSVPVVLSPLFLPFQLDIPLDKLLPPTITLEEDTMTSNLVDIVKEIGYSFTKNREQCRSHLLQHGLKNITPGNVARVLGLMARVPSGLIDPPTGQSAFSGITQQDSPSIWNAELFVMCAKELNPAAAWRDMVKELDHQGFYVSNKLGLDNLFKGIYKCVDTFPIDFLYSQWKNKDGQMSWISNALKYPDVFSFSDFPFTPVEVSSLKMVLDEKNRDIATWKSMDLIDLLLHLSDEGFHQQVLDLFKYPMTHCPDQLLLGILQSSCWNSLKQEMICNLIPLFLSNHPNALQVMNYTWTIAGAHSPTIRTMVLRCMGDWYMRDQHDQSRLARVLDVSQELKSLSVLLNGQPFPFVIDLACLASRREYLKLDKWLNDKIREHGFTFIEECINFLNVKCPNMVNPSKEDSQKNMLISVDTVSTLITCLQTTIGSKSVPVEMQESIMKMAQTFKTRQQHPSSRITSQMMANLPHTHDTPPNLSMLAFNSYPMGATQHLSRNIASNSPAKTTYSLVQPTLNQQQLLNQQQQQLFGNSVVGNISSQLQTLSLSSSHANNYSMVGNMMFSQAPPTNTIFPGGLAPRGGGGGQIGGSGANVPSFNPARFDGRHSSSSGAQAPLPSTTSAATTTTHNTLFIDPVVLGSSPLGLVGDMSQCLGPNNFSKELEEEVNYFFKRVFNHASVPADGQLGANDALELLRNYRTNPKETQLLHGGSASTSHMTTTTSVAAFQDTYTCLLRNLFEEYSFFQQYPDKELILTATLFGGIIDLGFSRIEAGQNSGYMALGFALRLVLDSLKKHFIYSKMFLFGVTALNHFRTKLKDCPQYCSSLMSFSPYNDIPQLLKEYIHFGSRAMDIPQNILNLCPPFIPPLTKTTTITPSTTITITATSTTTTTTTTISASHGVISRPPGTTVRNSIANATNIDTLLANREGTDNILVPPESLQDKVFFIFNNLSQANMDTKAAEMCEQVSDEMMPWVAQYLVMKRASTESNFHTLYANFIEQLKRRFFVQMVIDETFRNIKVLLRSDKGVANFSDRTLLKNLGHWLGMLLIAKNKPVLHLDLDVKSLIYEAYCKGADELLYVIPFIAKILESTAKSMVFRPPNPWTIGIMNVLGELHKEHDLKLNLKFEIEVLCKNLQIDINDLEPSNYLKDPSIAQELEHQLSPLNKAPPKDHLTNFSTIPALNIGEMIEENLEINMPPPSSMVPTPSNTLPDMPPATQVWYQDINTVTSLTNYMVINEQISLLQLQPQLKQYVRPAIERAIQELLSPVIERAITIGLKTSEIIVKKDFALDPDEVHLQRAAHNLIKFVTGGMSLITCHEPIIVSIINNLKTMFSTAIRNPTAQQKDLIDSASQIIAHDNADIATNFLQRMAIDKAIPEIDKRLAPDYEARKKAKSEGKMYYDLTVYQHQERMPEEIRLKLGSVTQSQLAVYEDFLRLTPVLSGHHQVVVEHKAATEAPPPPVATAASLTITTPLKNLQQPATSQSVDPSAVMDKLSAEVEAKMPQFGNSPLSQLVMKLQNCIQLARNNSLDINAATVLLQRIVENLLEGLNLMARMHSFPETSTNAELCTRFKDMHVSLLRTVKTQVWGAPWTADKITRCLMEAREDTRYNSDGVVALVQADLVSVPQYDLFLAQLIDANVSFNVVLFVMQLLQKLFIERSPMNKLQDGDFSATIDALQRAALHNRGPDNLPALLESVRQQSTESLVLDRLDIGVSAMMYSGINQASDFNDPPGLHEKAEYLLREWVGLYHQPTAGRDSSKAFSQFITIMHAQGILKTDDLVTRFFRLCTEMCVDLCYRALGEPNQSTTRVRFQCFHTLDAFVRLIVLLLKHSGENSNSVTKVHLLNKALGIIAGVLLHDHEVRKTEFHQLPYHRIIIMLFIELNAPEAILDTLNYDILQAFCNILHILRPSKAPGFSYAWLEVISHRVFIGRVLAINQNNKVWGMYAQLIIDLFSFLAPFLRNAELTKPTQLLYKGSMRVLLVLLHDFPELLCDYQSAFCDVIPPNCIQVRNLILSAFPRSMRLPDPFTPNLKVEMLQDINNSPTLGNAFPLIVQPASLKKDLDSYLKTRSPVTFLSDLRTRLQLSNTPGQKYNIPLLNSLVLHVGTQAISFIQHKGLSPNTSTIAHSSHMDIFQNLAVDLDTEGRYLFFNAMVNQLRYPNSHTNYFSCTLLYLFAEANTEAIQEQMTRVMLERLIVNRPHPWGLLVTFIELIKNPQYKFWSHDFVHCAPEIEKLLESVARSCSQSKPAKREGEANEAR